MNDRVNFLTDLLPRAWKPNPRHRLVPAGLFVGKGANAIEVAVARSANTPSRPALLESWKHRRAGRAAPVLLIVLHPNGASICGASGEEPPVYPKVDKSQVERLCREALGQPDRHAALRFLAQVLPSLETALPGLNNEGLLALNELQHGTPKRNEWGPAKQSAAGAVGNRNEALLNALGFKVEKLDNLTSLLRSGDRRAALAIMLRESESPEAGTPRFNTLSPVSYALAKADTENLPWVIVVQGSRLRLYSTSVDAGVGRRGRTETFIECQPTLLSDTHLPYLWLLFSADALAPDGSLNAILADSHRFAGELARRLRERVYDKVMPQLAQGIANARNLASPSREDLDSTYEMALTVLFRLLFIAYAEDRDLLPYRVNEAYRRRSLKQKALELAERVKNKKPIDDGSFHWHETALLWQAVAVGNREWGVPAYDGGLFASDPGVSIAGAALAEIVLPDRVFETALRALLVIETDENVPGPVDFRSLGVREFGTVYEGLLESELALAETDLTVDKKGTYLPARKNDLTWVNKGKIYLHNRSGVRKSSGSYYTKSFAVEHLLDGALEPGLTDHFARLAHLDEADAAEAFFDFRVADIAMGSGHFLIAAIDRIEKAMAEYLAKQPLSGVRRDLATLRDSAMKELGELNETISIEDGQLLRRMIARRCIYGVDLNPLSVQLARLSVWIHTFVPGLPLSFLDHVLVHGNSLVGIGTIDEIKDKLEETTDTLFGLDVEDLIGQAKKPLKRLANINDATLRDIAAAREAVAEVRGATERTKELCDLIAAIAISDDETVAAGAYDWERLVGTQELRSAVNTARQVLTEVAPVHFPIAFPEVFLRDRPGFDVIIGNPPWQEATVEENAFWARHFPGLRALRQRDQEAEKNRLRNERPDLVKTFETELAAMEQVRRALVGGNFPGMGTGDPDLYKAFCWRFWHLTSKDKGRIGVVLPRSALAAKGSSQFRYTMFEQSESVDITMLVNNRHWVFPEVHPQYTIGLVCILHGLPGERSIHLAGPFASYADFPAAGEWRSASFSKEEVLAWNDSVSLPLLPFEDSVEVFAQLRKAPRLDLNVEGEWRARPDTELHATNQKPLMDLTSSECPEGFWPVYKGESFNLWTPDTGIYYAFADPNPVQAWLQTKRLRAGTSTRDTAHGEFPRTYLQDQSTLACHTPRVAFRDVTNRTNQRTVIACLLPPCVFIGNQAPYLLWSRGNEKDQAYLLGILSSIPLDWYARRFVELHVNYFVFNPLPVPRADRDDRRRQRVVVLAGRLACPDKRFADWANAIGVAWGLLAEDEKEDMIHELDAVVGHLYGLSEQQLIHIFETFHEGWDYHERLTGVLKHFRAWRAQ